MTVEQRCKSMMAMREGISKRTRISSLPTIPEGQSLPPLSRSQYHLGSERAYNAGDGRIFQGGGNFSNATFGSPPVSRRSFISGLSTLANQINPDGSNTFTSSIKGDSPFQEHPRQNFPPEEETLHDDDPILF